MPSINFGNLIRQAGDSINPFNGARDYDVFGDISVSGGVRNPVNSTVNGINFGVGQQAPATTNTTGSAGSGSGKVTENPVQGGSAAGGGYNPELESARYELENSLGQYNSALGRIDNQLNTAVGNIQGDYESAYGRLTGQAEQAKRDFSTTRDNQLQDYQTARDSNNANSRNLLMGARRLLGSQGAGGGSADIFAAPLAAQQEGNNANAAVKQTNERNLGALTTAYEDNERNINNSMSDLARQRDQGIRDTRSQYEQQRAEALGGIGALQGQRALLNGQNYQQALAAAAPYTSRVQSILGQIDALAARPTGIKEQTVNLARPDLAQYNLGRFDAPAIARQDQTLATPAYNALTGQQDEQRRQLGY